MNHTFDNEVTVLAMDPTRDGFAYVIFEGPERFIDWGITHVSRPINPHSLKRVKVILEYYNPNVVVLEDCENESCRRCARVRRLIKSIVKLASEKKATVRTYSRAEIRKAFSTNRTPTKQEIAYAIASAYPELAPRLPRKRKAWMNEDRRMNIFDAAAMALTFFRHPQTVLRERH